MILITGATSQVGIVLISKLLEKGFQIRCLVRNTSKIDGLKQNGIEFSYGDLDKPESIRTAITGVDTIIHIAGIWRIDSLLNICKQKNFSGRVIFIGSTSRFKKLDSTDEKERLLAEKMCEAEQKISRSGLDYVILRPTMLYGLDKDKNILQIIKFMKRFRFYPLIGNGTGEKHPVYVGDVADAIIDCTNNPNVSRKEYIIAGSSPIKHKDMLKAIRHNLPFKAFIIRVPVFLAYIAVFLFKLIKPSSYINYAMVKRVNENITYDISSASKDFGYDPVDFETGVSKQIKYLLKNGQI